MKKTISLLLSVIIAFSGMFFINNAYAVDCEHNYEPSYDYNEETNVLTITPVCTLCEDKDEENALVLSNFAFNDGALSVDINNAENPYITELGFDKYIKDGKISLISADAIDFLYSISDSISDEDKAALAEELGVDARLFTCKHEGIKDINNYNLEMTDTSSGVGRFTCPDCGLVYEIHFTLSNVDLENKKATIYIQELDRSFDIDLTPFIDFLTSQLGEVTGGSGTGTGSTGYPGGLSEEEINQLIQLIDAYTGGGSSDLSSFKPAGSKIKKIKRLKKSLKVTFKKVDGVTGYQIKYSTSKKFTKKTTKTVKVKAGKSSVTIKKLKKKKRYYVKIRTYVKFNGTKINSKWSKAKSQKTK